MAVRLRFRSAAVDLVDRAVLMGAGVDSTFQLSYQDFQGMAQVVAAAASVIACPLVARMPYPVRMVLVTPLSAIVMGQKRYFLSSADQVVVAHQRVELREAAAAAAAARS